MSTRSAAGPSTSLRPQAPPPVGRLAPSPTGRLHVGHARSFLLAWWSVRSRDGRILLRIEDLDQERARAAWRSAILSDLEWLGLDWDGEVVLQSDALAPVEAACARLVESGRVYPCVCTRREVAEAASAPHDESPGRPTAGVSPEPVYPGTCRGRYRDLAEAERSSGRPACLRFELPPDPEVRFVDALQGPQLVDLGRHGGDFVVARKGGAPAYQLAVVASDAHQGVTEVLRGDDLLVSTARQLLLQQALDLPHPTWAHVPLVQDPTGERLAKRSGGLSLEELRSQGVAPERLVAWVARSAGRDVARPSTAAELVPGFDLAQVPVVPVGLGPSFPD